MANFAGRRAPNVSQYIANLNTIPSEYNLAAQQEENYSLADDLATFTNADFYDFDLGDDAEQSNIEYDHAREERLRRLNSTASKSNGKGLDFGNGMLLSSVHDFCLDGIPISSLPLRRSFA